MAKPRTPRPRVKPLGLSAVDAPSAPVTVAAPLASLSLPRAAGFWYVAALIFSLCSPVAGLTLGFLYARQDDASARRFGRWCFALAIVGAILGALGGAVKSALGSGEWFVQPYY